MYWLLKTEPASFSIDDLMAAKNQITSWEGVRNYQARNFLREMKLGDLAFFYHSSCAEPGIVGLVSVVKESYPDKSAFDEHSQYYDVKSQRKNPRWFTVDVKLIRKFTNILSLKELRLNSDLAGFRLLNKGNRLSVLPVSAEHFEAINTMEKNKS